MWLTIIAVVRMYFTCITTENLKSELIICNGHFQWELWASILSIKFILIHFIHGIRFNYIYGNGINNYLRSIHPKIKWKIYIVRARAPMWSGWIERISLLFQMNFVDHENESLWVLFSHGCIEYAPYYIELSTKSSKNRFVIILLGYQTWLSLEIPLPQSLSLVKDKSLFPITLSTNMKTARD